MIWITSSSIGRGVPALEMEMAWEREGYWLMVPLLSSVDGWCGELVIGMGRMGPYREGSHCLRGRVGIGGLARR